MILKWELLSSNIYYASVEKLGIILIKFYTNLSRQVVTIKIVQKAKQQ